MQNPFLNKNFIKVYVVAWLIIAIIQFLFSHLIMGFSPLSATFQSITSNLSFAILGFGIWFVVKYKTPKKNKIQILLMFFFAGILVVGIWMGINYIISNLLFKISSGLVIFKNNILGQIIIGSLLYIILILIYHLMIIVSKYTEKSISEERLQNLLTETKLNALKAYINPHFLFNSLNSVNALITENPKKAREMLINLSEYFRYSLKQKDNTFVNFEDELKNALTYLEIERLRFSDRIILNMHIDEKGNNVKVPVMILQPLFENIIKHSVSESFEPIKVNFKSKMKQDYLEVIINNTYDKDSISKKGTGIGLSTNIERFRLIYQRNDLIEISKNDKTFEIILKIPINLNNNI